jgi:transaldolase/glucose-6-phosphate isomerase
MATARTRMHQAHDVGQSIWYDNMRRGLLRSGALAGLIDKGLRGLTSNPTIFERAIVASTDYEEPLRRLATEGHSAAEIYETLAVEDIRGACDLFMPVYEQSGAVDGRVSLELLPELATVTDRSVQEGVRLAKLVGRPNVMIKVPATPEGIPAVRQLTAAGVSVNITLIFSLLQYEEVVEAYLAGLEDRKAKGGSFQGMASVASFFVSRVDTACDKLLEEKAAANPSLAARCQALRGKIAVANAKMAYDIYERTIASPRWKALAAAGARPQRLLWASTGTKDPRYPDTYYVDGLMGPDTVDTVPPATLDAFLDHGDTTPHLTQGLDDAKKAVAELSAVGIDLARVCHGLLADGLKSFATSMNALIDAIGARRAAIAETASKRQQPVLPEALRLAADAEVAQLAGSKALKRLWESDATLFSPNPEHEKSVKSRLGWLRSPAAMRAKVAELTAFADEVVGEGYTDAVLLGMGGSSLCPEVLALTWPAQPRALRLHVLDNTDPAAVARVDQQIAGKKTLYLVASKSGGTIEIQSFERHFWKKALDAHGGDVARAGRSFVAITDPATKLGQMAEEKKYRRAFINPADIGGRYSALSYFGLVPAALLRAPLDAMLADAETFAQATGAVVPPEESPGLRLGAILGAACKAGRDKLTLIASPEVASLGSWVEQLVAESTGKEGKGIVPIDLEPLGSPEVYGNDRLFVYVRLGAGDPRQEAGVEALQKAGQPVVRIDLPGREALGREFFRWEVATAIAGATLGVNPFDEPNVTEAKVATGGLLEAFAKDGRLPAPEATVGVDDLDRIAAHLSSAGAGDYVALCAYFLRTDGRDAALTRLRVLCRDRARNATTLGYGPRFLHSTGQLHKGGANNGVFLQLTADAPQDLAIPGEGYSFATLRNAQALGDLQVLLRRKRRALRVHLGSDVEGGLGRLVEGLTTRLAGGRK